MVIDTKYKSLIIYLIKLKLENSIESVTIFEVFLSF